MDEAQMGQEAGLLGGFAKANRRKTWDDYTDDERIQALRDEVRSLRDIVRELTATVYALQHHEHGAKGDVLVRLASPTGHAVSGRYDPLR